MERKIRIKLIIIFITFLLSLYLIFPLLPIEIPDVLKVMFPKRKVLLGLDLKGGTHLILGVDVDSALKNLMDRIISDSEEFIKEKSDGKGVVKKIDAYSLSVTIPSNLEGEFEAFILERYSPQIIREKSEVKEGFATVVFKLAEGEIDRLAKNTLDQAIETIRNRIDQFGVAEPIVQRHGSSQILIQLPGIQDIERAKAIIGKTALLEFKIVADDVDFFSQFKDSLPDGVYLSYENVLMPDGSGKSVPYLWSRSESLLKSLIEGKVPENYEVLFGPLGREEVERRAYRTYLLQSKTLLTGQYIKTARVRFSSQFNEPYVAIDFTTAGGKIFEEITSRNVGRRLAIILDRRVYSAPRIKERISGGSAVIEGTFTTEEASDLAIVLRAGSLPAPVTVEEERTVGPSLGKESIKRGIISLIVGGGSVFIFMIFYYRLSGLLADFLLLFNIILILAIMGIFEATLTFPGIAGLVLTAGMAVDANVLIFERMREEIRIGRTPRSVVETGFNRAFSTILDSNLTTIIAASILFQFGTGPIKGFAVTLTVGILSSMFTAIFVCRTIFEYFVHILKIEKVSI